MIYLLFKCTRHTRDPTHAHTRAPIFFVSHQYNCVTLIPCRSHIAVFAGVSRCVHWNFCRFSYFTFISFVYMRTPTDNTWTAPCAHIPCTLHCLSHTSKINLHDTPFSRRWRRALVLADVILFIIVFVAVVCLCVWLFLNIAQHAEGSISVVVLNVQLYFGPETVKTYTVVSNFVDNFLIWFSLNSFLFLMEKKMIYNIFLLTSQCVCFLLRFPNNIRQQR